MYGLRELCKCTVQGTDIITTFKTHGGTIFFFLLIFSLPRVSFIESNYVWCMICTSLSYMNRVWLHYEELALFVRSYSYCSWRGNFQTKVHTSWIKIFTNISHYHEISLVVQIYRLQNNVDNPFPLSNINVQQT